MTPRGTLYAGWYSGGVGEGLLNYSILSRKAKQTGDSLGHGNRF
ncbi:MAG: hypothetical protein V8T87_03715 [Victivallales bacterium]